MLQVGDYCFLIKTPAHVHKTRYKKILQNLKSRNGYRKHLKFKKQDTGGLHSSRYCALDAELYCMHYSHGIDMMSVSQPSVVTTVHGKIA